MDMTVNDIINTLKQYSDEYRRASNIMRDDNAPYRDKIFNCGIAIQSLQSLKELASRYPAVVVLDLINEEMKYCEGMYTDYLKKQSDKQVDVFFIGEFVYINNLVYIASCLQNMILKFNLNTLEHEYIQIGDKSNHYAGIGYDGSYFYLSPRNKKDAVKWEGSKKCEINF